MAPPTDSTTAQAPAQQAPDASGKLYEASHKFLGGGQAQPAQEATKHTGGVGQIVSEVAGTLTSGVAGGVAFALISRTPYGMAAGLIGSAAVGALVNTGVKAGFEQLLVSPQDRDISWKDLAWGAANGLSGSIGAIAETRASAAYAERVGLQSLGRLEDSAKLREAGFRMFESSLSYKYKANIMRGLVGGAAGTFAYSLPHSTANHWSELSNGHAGSAVAGILKDTAIDTTIGSLTGGVLGAAATTVFNRADVIGYTRAKYFANDLEHTKLNIGHVNDVHSSLVNDTGGHPFARMSTEATRISEQAQAKGVSSHFINAGDEFGGTEIDVATHNGLVENKTLQLAMQPTARTMGNHAVDKAESITEWLRNAQLLHNETGEMNTVVSNVAFDRTELAKHADIFSKAGLDPKLLEGEIVGTGKDSIVKPYLVRTIQGPHGPERVGYIGLVTEEIDPMGLQVNPGMSRETMTMTERNVASAKQAIERLKADPANADIQKVILVSHLGRGQDVQLAKQVEGLSAIIGAHSHDAQPIPHWVKGNNGWNVPVVQAGNDMKWLGQLELAFKPNSGEVDKYFTTGRLLPLTEKIAEDPAVVGYLKQQPFYSRVEGLHAAEGYGKVKTTGEFTVESVRAKETTMGNTVANALHAGTDANLAAQGSDIRLNAFLKHSGDVRKTIPGGVDLTGWHFANIFCNGENTMEVTVAKMNGESIRRALEFGVQDMPAPEAAGSGFGKVKSFASNLFKAASEERPDYSGNFLQSSGVRYEIDLSQAAIKAEGGALANPGSRIKNIQIWSPTEGQWTKLNPEENYYIGNLFHPFDKWAKSGIYDDMLNLKGLEGDALKKARVNGVHALFETETGVNSPKFVGENGQVYRGIGMSQPNAMVDYLSGNTKLDPGLLAPHKVVYEPSGAPVVHPDNLGKIDGRIKNITPKMQGASWKAIATLPVAEWTNDKRQSQ